MSYAAVAARGPQQTAEEVSEHIAQIISDVYSRIRRSTCTSPRAVRALPPSRTAVSSKIWGYTNRTFHRRAPHLPEVAHTDESVSSLVDVDSPHVSSVPSDYESQPVKTETQAERARLEAEAKEKAEHAKREAAAKKEHAKKNAEKAKKSMKENSDNPVVIGNAVAMAAFAGVLGVGAYRKYTAGELTWKVAGLWAGVVGLFAVGDYYVSQYLFKKYPPKE
ncbi:hypothetical protein LTR66_004607 [Elasticomyces elasticus]|nr:hypothetical protein LTR50_002165 [Elasticomyces elasticus]KAK4995604.1 hypothetical protein LTR66_004607 [Elasticomyces elasticus]